MFEKKIKIVLLNLRVKLPKIIEDKNFQYIKFFSMDEIRLLAGETKIIDLGLKIILPKGYSLLFINNNKDDKLVIYQSIIDENFTNRLYCKVVNTDIKEKSISKYQNFCQGILFSNHKCKIEKCNKKEFYKYLKK